MSTTLFFDFNTTGLGILKSPALPYIKNSLERQVKKTNLVNHPAIRLQIVVSPSNSSIGRKVAVTAPGFRSESRQNDIANLFGAERYTSVNPPRTSSQARESTRWAFRTGNIPPFGVSRFHRTPSSHPRFIYTVLARASGPALTEILPAGGNGVGLESAVIASLASREHRWRR